MSTNQLKYKLQFASKKNPHPQGPIFDFLYISYFIFSLWKYSKNILGSHRNTKRSVISHNKRQKFHKHDFSLGFFGWKCRNEKLKMFLTFTHICFCVFFLLTNFIKMPDARAVSYLIFNAVFDLKNTGKMERNLLCWLFVNDGKLEKPKSGPYRYCNILASSFRVINIHFKI